jgi:RNA polymerase sigma factor (sigma-70 family)
MRSVGKNGPANINMDEAERLMARFHGPLMSFFLRRVRDREDAEDLTQEAFLRILRRDEAVPVDNPESYVFRVAVNLLRDRARRAASHRASEHASLDDQAADLAASGKVEPALVEDRQPERVLLSQESLAEALQVLEELGPRTRDIFMLARLERMKHRDIAAVYGMTISAVEKHVAKAAVHLTHRFGPK